jgi:predicted lactoylglutathione lyase
MSTKIFVNLQVNDLDKSKKFFTKLGYKFNPQFTDEKAACLVISDDIYAMLVVKNFFKTFTKKELVNAKKSTEAILALSVDSRKAVDTLLKKALAAGGKINRPPEDHGWMYGRSFSDLDGHIWEAFWMDENKINKPTQKPESRVIHFEIHATDPEKMITFYTNVFGWKIEEWKMPDVTPENRYWMITTAAANSNKPGINGGMVVRRGPLPIDGEPVAAFICTIDVADFDTAIKKIEAAGGQVTVPKMAIPSMAWLGYCKDPEGNIFGIFQEDKNAKNNA